MTATLNQRQPLNIQGAIHGTARVRLDHTDLTAAATTQTITWAALVRAHPIGASSPPANAYITGVEVVRITDFAGGTVSAIVIDVGDADDVDELVDGADVFTGAKATAAVTGKTGVYTLGTFESAYTPQVFVTATDDNLVDLTAGACEIQIRYIAVDTNARING